MADCKNCIHEAACQAWIGRNKFSDYFLDDCLNFAPTVEVVHGQWEVVPGVITPGGDPLLRCPRCKSRESEHLGGIECNRAHWNYCPICGMTMDGGNNDVR